MKTDSNYSVKQTHPVLIVLRDENPICLISFDSKGIFMSLTSAVVIETEQQKCYVREAWEAAQHRMIEQQADE